MTLIKSKKLFFQGILIALLSAFFDLLSKKMIFAMLEDKTFDNNIHNSQIKVSSFFNLVKVICSNCFFNSTNSDNYCFVNFII